MKIKDVDFENYMGDMSLEFGGWFFDLSDIRHGYANVLAAEDLDSAAGVDWTYLVERRTVLLLKGKQFKRAVDSGIGWGAYKNIPAGESRLIAAIDACMSYGQYDVVQDYNGTHRWIVCIPPDLDDAPEREELESWEGEVHLLPPDSDLGEWLLDQGLLNNFE